ncbi:MAG: class I SAM-dependent methyltransferase [Candidatus Nanosalina sp.]
MTPGLDYREVFSDAMDREGEVELYGESADLFDILYSQMNTREKKEASVRRNVSEGSKVLDLACGTGIVSEAIDGDYDVTGADLSRDMLEVARSKDLQGDFVQADMQQLSFEEEFDAVLMYGQPFSHLESREAVEAAADSVYDSLKSEGVMITDVFAEDAGRLDVLGPEKDVFDENHEMVMKGEFTDYDAEEHSWNSYLVFQLRKGNQRTQVWNQQELRGYSMADMEEILQDSGFSVVGEEEIYPMDIYNGVWAVK